MYRRSYRLLTIDLDDTLWPCGPAIAAAEQALYDWLRLVAPRLTDIYDPASLRLHRGQLMANLPDMAHDLTRVRRESLSALLTEQGYSETLADEAVDLFRQHRNRVEPYRDVMPALSRLSDRYLLVSVTNGNAEVDQTSLSGLFHLSLSAADVGAAKPDPALFIRALDWAGAEPGQCLHIGDDPVRDVEAACQFGIDTVWVNRRGSSWPEGLEPPTFEVTRLDELCNILRACTAGAKRNRIGSDHQPPKKPQTCPRKV